LTTTPASKDVKYLYDVFSWGREALAEYIFHGEIDSRAMKEDGTGDLAQADYSASVEVSFEIDTLDVARSTISSSKLMPLFPSLEVFSDKTPEAFFDTVNAPDGSYLVDCDGTHCFIAIVVNFSKTVVFKNVSVDDHRTKEITVVGKGSEIELGEMYNKAASLAETYSDIPYNLFTGAIRE